MRGGAASGTGSYPGAPGFNSQLRYKSKAMNQVTDMPADPEPAPTSAKYLSGYSLGGQALRSGRSDAGSTPATQTMNSFTNIYRSQSVAGDMPPCQGGVVGSIPAGCSNRSGQGGCAPTPTVRGRSVGGCVSVFQTEGMGSTPIACSPLEVYPVLPSSLYMLGRPVDWCPPVIFGQGAGRGTVSKTELGGFDSLPACCRQHQDREERF